MEGVSDVRTDIIIAQDKFFGSLGFEFFDKGVFVTHGDGFGPKVVL